MTYTAEQNRERSARLRAEWLADNGPCQGCGSTENLEVDHVDPAEKSFNISFSMGKKKLTGELAKCQVLCHDCHLEKTAAQRPTTCRQGHELSGDNLMDRVIAGSKGTRCRACQQDYNRKYMQRVRGRSD